MKLLALLFLFPLFSFAQDFREEYVPNGDVNLYVKVFGEGDPIILINGGPGMNSNGFDELAIKLAENNQVLLYDQRGTGKSVMEVDEDLLTMDLMVDDLEAIREHFNFSVWIVYGHSFGGMLAYKYAAENPEHVWAMVQSSSGGMDLSIRNSILVMDRLSEKQRDSLNYYTELIREGDESPETRTKQRSFLAYAYVYNDEFAPVILSRLEEANLSINRLLWDDMIDNEFDQREALEYFDAPVLIIYGDEDVVDDYIAEDAHETLENSEVEVVPNCGHYGWLDNPEFYFDKVHSFLQALPAIE